MDKRIFFLLVCLFIYIVAKADGIRITITDGIDNSIVKKQIENNVTKILNEINAAYNDNRALDFSKMEVNRSVQHMLNKLWENTPFMCTDNEIVEHCIITGIGYQIRNIHLVMKPNIKDRFNKDECQDAVINFDKQGNVENIYLSIPSNLYMKVIKSNLKLSDLRHRQVIVDYVERLRTAYSQKNIIFLTKVYLDDGLNNLKMLKVSRKNKKKHLRQLRRAFKHNQEVKINVNDIEVIRHPVNPSLYGVTIKLQWSIENKQEGGYLFQLWDLTNEDAPQIHLCTWQPDKIGGKPLPKDEVFSLSDFDI